MRHQDITTNIWTTKNVIKYTSIKINNNKSYKMDKQHDYLLILS